MFHFHYYGESSQADQRLYLQIMSLCEKSFGRIQGFMFSFHTKVTTQCQQMERYKQLSTFPSRRRRHQCRFKSLYASNSINMVNTPRKQREREHKQ